MGGVFWVVWVVSIMDPTDVREISYFKFVYLTM